jgi:hypothetical protein
MPLYTMPPMLVQVRDDETWLVRQQDHALLSGQMAQAWGAPGFDLPGPHHLMTIAASIHDVGWQEVDDAPLLNPATGAPHNVFDYPTEGKLEFFPRGVDRAEQVHPLVGLLNSLHYSTFGFLLGEAEFQRHESERQRRLRRAVEPRWLFAGEDSDTVIRTQLEFLRLLDRLSLFICNMVPGSRGLHLPGPDPKAVDPWEAWAGYLGADLFEHVPENRTMRPLELRWDGDNRLVLDPFPFQEPVRVLLPYRRLAGERVADAAQLRERWTAGESRVHELTLSPA